MIFSSTVFLFLFLPVTLAGYYLLKEEYRNYWLLFLSFIFFAWSQPRYTLLIVISILINYTIAILLTCLPKFRKILLILAIVLNLGMLFYFKYFDFVINSVNKIIGTRIKSKNIVLPVGISFFTFQGLSYVVDVYRKEVLVQKNPLKVGLYIAFFPQLIAGPIVRYKSIAEEIEERKILLDDFVSGIERFIIGLGKKAIIANTMALTADTIWQTIGNNSIAIAWIGSIAYTLQIYFDFSGYSDMAIGLGRMFGFHFDENFDYPYVAKNITEFWRRWHISLSSWFRDYLYIPLGGNKKHVYLNLIIVFLFTGIWHGAAWNFIVWGVWHGFFRLIERYISNKKKKIIDKTSTSKQGKTGKLLKNIVGWFYMILVVNFGWVLFRADGLKSGYNYIKSMLGLTDAVQPVYKLGWYLDKWTIFILVIAIILSLDIPKKFYMLVNCKVNINIHVQHIMRYIALLAVFLISIMQVVSGTYNPFIYFRF